MVVISSSPASCHQLDEHCSAVEAVEESSWPASVLPELLGFLRLCRQRSSGELSEPSKALLRKLSAFSLHVCNAFDGTELQPPCDSHRTSGWATSQCLTVSSSATSDRPSNNPSV